MERGTGEPGQRRVLHALQILAATCAENRESTRMVQVMVYCRALQESIPPASRAMIFTVKSDEIENRKLLRNECGEFEFTTLAAMLTSGHVLYFSRSADAA
jgi:hypothetical protein